MDRARRTTQRRKPPGVSTSPQSASEASFDLNFPNSPTTANATGTPNTAPQGRRGSKSLQHAFTFSTPGPNRGLNARKKSKTMDNYADADEDDNGPRKGGHSLRKRARVDYTFEQIDDEVLVPNSTSSARGRKRRSDANHDAGDFYGTDSKRRGASMGADTPSTRRRNPSRKSAEVKAYRDHHHLEEDDNDVKDVIEVGVSYSDLDESEFHNTSLSTASSPHSEKATANSEHEVTRLDEIHQSPQPVKNTPEHVQQPQIVPASDFFETDEKAAEEAVEQVVEQAVAETAHHQLADEPARPAEEVAAPQTPAHNSKQSEEPTQPPPIVMEEVNGDSEPTIEPASITSPPPTEKEEPSPQHNTIIKQELDETIVDDISKSPLFEEDDKMAIDSPEVPNTAVEMAYTEQPDEQQPQKAGSTLTPPPAPETSHEATASPKMEPGVQADDSEKKFDEPAEQPQVTQPEAIESTDEPGLEQPVKQADEQPDVQSVEQPIEQAVEQPNDKVDTQFIEKPDAQADESADTKIDETTDAMATHTTVDATADAAIEADTNTKLDRDDDTETDAQVDTTAITKSDEPVEKQVDEQPTVASPSPKPEDSSNDIQQSPPPTEQKSPELKPVVVEEKEEKATSPPPADTAAASSQPTQLNTPAPSQQAPLPQPKPPKPQPAPVGRWAHLTPYLEGEYTLYPEKKARSDEEATGDDQTPEEKDNDKDTNDMEPMVEDNDDNADPTALEAPTPALNTPLRGSPVPESTDPTTFNSPAPAGDEPDDAEISESQEPPDHRRYFKYRKLRDPEEYISAIENYEDMSTADLYEILEAVNVSLVEWQDEWTGLGKIVDDYENSLRRRAADAKYEARTRNLHQHGVNYEEPDFAVKGYKAKDKETMNETRYLQGQDRIMASAYGFEYDPHPSKIGRQNPETQQVGIMTRGRSLRNQPRQTAKATETEEVMGKRQRKPVQLFDPATQDASRSSTPVPTRGRRKRGANADAEENQIPPTSSFNTDVASDNEGPAPKRRKRGPRAKGIPSIVEEYVPTPEPEEPPVEEESLKPTRRGRGKPAVRYDEPDPNEFIEEEPQPEMKPPRRHLLMTLKIPRGKNLSEPASVEDNGESRPSSAGSESSSHTAESSYSFRPKRQKRFRDDPDENETAAPPKKRGKRTSGNGPVETEASTPMTFLNTTDSAPAAINRKVQKIKVVRSVPESRNGTPGSTTPAIDDGDEPQKDYKSMTKSEKMSASMKSKLINVPRCCQILTDIQTVGPTVTWLARLKSERRHSLRRRLRNTPQTRNSDSSLQSQRAKRLLRRRLLSNSEFSNSSSSSNRSNSIRCNT